MTDSDWVLQGILIGAFGSIGTAILICYLRKRSSIKKSSSREELSSVCTDDPQV